MNINLKDLIVEKEKKISLNQFFPESIEEEYLTIKKMDNVDKMKLRFMQNSLYQSEFFKKNAESKKTYSEIMEELEKDQNENDIKQWVNLGEMIVKTQLDLSILPEEKHTFFYMDGEKKIMNHIDYDSLLKLGNDKLIDYIYSECKNWNSNFFF
jgi:hypothetical protein